MITNGSAPSATNGSLVIAGVDPAFRHGLLESLTVEHPSREIAEVTARPGLYHDVAALRPSVVLFDVGVRADTDALGMVSALSALAKVIVLADLDDDALAIQALKAGASGFCPRDTAPALIRKAVRLVEAGEIWVGRRVLLRLIEELAELRADAAHDFTGADLLTPRERDIASLIARGESNKQIACDLSISVKTVKAHLTNVFKKLGVSTRVQLALTLGRPSDPQTKVG
ncbi:MAG: LuxR C-terminal-related transcriptional regulator [Candidatus Rokuibacteriota bacterium]